VGTGRAAAFKDESELLALLREPPTREDPVNPPSPTTSPGRRRWPGAEQSRGPPPLRQPHCLGQPHRLATLAIPAVALAAPGNQPGPIGWDDVNVLRTGDPDGDIVVGPGEAAWLFGQETTGSYVQGMSRTWS
jgi:hypothetical protein